MRIKRWIGWGILALLALIGVSIVLPFILASKPGSFNYPFVPYRFGWLGGIFLLFIIFWGAKWFFWTRRVGWYNCEPRSAKSILKERYAKGQITKEQFHQMMLDLENDS